MQFGDNTLWIADLKEKYTNFFQKQKLQIISMNCRYQRNMCQIVLTNFRKKFTKIFIGTPAPRPPRPHRAGTRAGAEGATVGHLAWALWQGRGRSRWPGRDREWRGGHRVRRVLLLLRRILAGQGAVMAGVVAGRRTGAGVRGDDQGAGASAGARGASVDAETGGENAVGGRALVVTGEGRRAKSRRPGKNWVLEAGKTSVL